jgi:hypothetical protein
MEVREVAPSSFISSNATDAPSDRHDKINMDWLRTDEAHRMHMVLVAAFAATRTH